MKLSVAGIGRAASAQVVIGAEGFATALSYGHSKGFYAGLSIDSFAITTR